MATREENLKKINEELEKLSDDELEKIAGGYFLRAHDSSSQPDSTGPLNETGPLGAKKYLKKRFK